MEKPFLYVLDAVRKRQESHTSILQVWKDEAFELAAAWADLYKESSPKSAQAIRDIFDSFYLSEFPR